MPCERDRGTSLRRLAAGGTTLHGRRLSTPLTAVSPMPRRPRLQIDHVLRWTALLLLVAGLAYVAWSGRPLPMAFTKEWDAAGVSFRAQRMLALMLVVVLGGAAMLVNGRAAVRRKVQVGWHALTTPQDTAGRVLTGSGFLVLALILLHQASY